MALMTEKRRKEMEEEMSRFELEIAVPGEGKSPLPPDVPNEILVTNSKPLSPPPPPPAVTSLIPEVLAKAPPPPPPLSPPVHAALCPPPPPPVLQTRPPPPAGSIRFIPPQLQRHPPRPPVRPNFMSMRGPPIAGPPGPFPPPGHMGHFGPPMTQGPPITGPPMPAGAPMHPMPPGPMPMPPCPPMAPQMGGMNVNLPMPPGFCPPPGPPMVPANPGNLRCESQPFISAGMTQTYETTVSTSSPTTTSSEISTVVAAAPAVYAAPFVKSHSDITGDTFSSANGQEQVSAFTSLPVTPKTEKQYSIKSSDEPSVGPIVPPTSGVEEALVSKKKEKKKKIIRMAGGQAWEDNSLLEWDPDDFRIFCGDLGNDVTDEVLIRAFSKYQSFVKAKVIRDKRTNKTKGYGFVSFKDPQDFIKAMREMNGRYVGSRPIKLRKSTWRDRNIDLVKKKQREKEKLGLL